LAGRTEAPQYLSGKTRAEVVAPLRGVQRAQEDGQAVTSGDRPLTVEQRLMFWVDNIAARKVRYSTLSAYRGYIVNRIVPSLGRHRLDRLQPEHLETFCRKCEEQGLAAATVLQMHRVLSRALKVAVQRGRIPRNVATLVDAPSVKRPEVEPLTPEDARRVLATAESARNAARWSVALALGLRQGEALGLRWDAVDLERGTLNVRRRCSGRPAAVWCSSLRSRLLAGERIVLPAPLVAALRAHKAAQAPPCQGDMRQRITRNSL